ncbi:hypothetical protein TELCIR_01830 [Teladorsagia circumcincta]|uniref:Uncharacterized protein n=1 Tax=Teladorsagia circumcincta TaxID=45464 RepID=A0A2G9V122_TELCI|nr:hypothetical protein TELCIR_01830 [Teladorsagia circumcincta]
MELEPLQFGTHWFHLSQESISFELEKEVFAEIRLGNNAPQITHGYTDPRVEITLLDPERAEELE